MAFTIDGMLPKKDQDKQENKCDTKYPVKCGEKKQSIDEVWVSFTRIYVHREAGKNI